MYVVLKKCLVLVPLCFRDVAQSNMVKVQLILVLMMFSSVVSQEQTCFPKPCIGYVLPDDPYVFIGNNVTLHCTLASSKGSSFLYFSWKDDKNISSEYQRVISPRTLQLNMPVTGPDFDDVMIMCCDSRNQSWSVGEQVLMVEYPPQNMTDVQILVDDWKSLKLTWTVPKYLHYNYIVNVTWRATGSFKSGYKCSKETNTSCTLGPSDYNDSSQYFFNISITDAVIQHTHVQSLEIKPDFYVRTTPVELQGYNKTERCVTLWWNHKKHLSRHLMYKILVDHSSNTSEIKRNSTYLVNRMSTTICELLPYQKYTIFISAKNNESIYWSTGISVTILTNEGVPCAGSDSTPGIYSTDIVCSQNKRTVYLYLRLPDKDCWNGKLTNYRLTYVSSDGSHNITSEPEIDMVYDRVKLVCNLDYDVYISVYTKIGGSPPSHLHIPRQGTVLKPMEVRVSFNKSSDQLEWKTLERHVVSWTVFWCRGTQAFPNCQGPINWKNVSGLLRYSSINYHADYIYGIAMVTENGSSGITWAYCIYEYEKVPAGKPPPPAVDPEPHLGLTVRWRPKICDDNVLTTHYIIQHCIHATNHCVSDKVPVSQSQLEIQHLEEGVKYDVSLKQITAAGREGLSSKSLTAVPEFIGWRPEIIAVMIFFGGTAVVILIPVIMCLLRFINRKWTERYPIVVPGLQTKRFATVVPRSPVKQVKIKVLEKQPGKNEYLCISSVDRGRGSTDEDVKALQDGFVVPTSTLTAVLEGENSCTSAESRKQTGQQCDVYSIFGRGETLQQFSSDGKTENDYPYVCVENDEDDTEVEDDNSISSA